MSSAAYSDDYYSDAAGEDAYSDSESEDSREKERQRKREKKLQKKEKKVRKKEKKLQKKEKKRAKKERKKERKRKRSPSYSSSGSDDDRGARRGGAGGRRASPARPPRTQPRARSRSAARPAVKDLPPLDLPADGNLSLEQACEAAGRGLASGNTVLDSEISVMKDDESIVDKPEKFESFDEIKEFPREIRSALKDAGFPGPSQVQAYTWPLGIRGKDIIGIAATGSGKTLAFLLPAFSHMMDEGHKPERSGPGLLVLSPTRELAQQIETEASRFGRAIGFRCVAMYGGSPKNQQMNKYRQGVHCIVACPGRLNDFLESSQVRLEGCSRLVLDEADRMLDMGFEPQIRKILAKVPRKRHTMFFTATWPREVRSLAADILHRPYKVMIGNRDVLKGNQDITQLVRIVDPHYKFNAIVDLFREAGLTRRESCGKVLAFCSTKRMCEQLCQQLARCGFPCASIHGDKDQMQRDDALNGLKSGRIKILVATDVAARGLDIKGVGLVANFDPANNSEDYVHRIGRTGRAGAKGYAVTFLTTADAPKARGIVEVMERTDQNISDDLRRLSGCAPAGRRRKGGKGEGKGKRGGRSRSRSRSRFIPSKSRSRSLSF